MYKSCYTFISFFIYTLLSLHNILRKKIMNLVKKLIKLVIGQFVFLCFECLVLLEFELNNFFFLTLSFVLTWVLTSYYGDYNIVVDYIG